MRRRTLAFLFALLVIPGTVQLAKAFAPSPVAEYAIPFPGDQFNPLYDMEVQDQLAAAAPGWQRFVAEMGPNWRAFLWNQATQVPDFAAGAPIAVLAAGYHDEADVAARAMDFVTTIRDMVRVRPEDLSFESLDVMGDRAYVHFQQSYQGLPVYYALLTLHLEYGGVNAISAGIYPDIQIDTTPTLTDAMAVESAHVDMPWNPETAQVKDVQLGVLPVVIGQHVNHYLVYRVSFQTRDPLGDWLAFVDANTGDCYWRFDQNSYYTINGNDHGDIQPRRADDPYSDLPVPEQEVTADGHLVHTDSNGNFSVTVTLNQNYAVTAGNRGYWVRVYDVVHGHYSTVTTTASPSQPANLYWTDAQCSPAERDAYYHANTVHAWLKSIDPTWSGMDFQVQANVNETGCTCNATAGGSLMTFCAEGGGCNNFGQLADVLYHEYHHIATSVTYLPSYPPTSSGMNEGFSDYCAMTIVDDYCMSPSWNQSNPDGCMRSGLNLRRYPGTECGGEEHCLGEILMGGLWKVRRNLLEKYGDGFAHQVDLYFRQAVRSKQYSMPNFVQQFLLANDNNADLSDGTPDYWEICDGFGENGLSCPNITKKIVFTHTPLGDQENISQPVLVAANIAATAGAGNVIPDSTRVFYSYNGTNFVGVTMSNLGSGNYQAYIPLVNGVLVDYYLRSVTTTGIKGTDPIRAPERNRHRFLAGPQTAILNDNLETDMGWTLGALGDDACDGLWQRVDPTGKQYNSQWVQPENDHTAGSGVKCFVTDGRGGFYANYNVDCGKTTVTSPAFDLTTSGAGFVDFYSFFSQFGPINDDSLLLYASRDGSDWVRLWEIHGSGYNNPNFDHQKVYFRAEALGGFSSTVRFKFVAEDNENNTITEAAVDDVVIRTCQAGSSLVDGPPAPALTFRTDPAMPSPFSGSTTMRFQIPNRQRVEFRVYDPAGRLVRTVADEVMGAGAHALSWDGRTDEGHAAPSGIYYAMIRAGASEARSKVVLTR